MKRLSVVLLAASAISSASLGHAAEDIIFKVRNISMVSLDDVSDDLRNTRFVVIGESHSDPDHHRAQLAVIRKLHGDGFQVSIGLEMFRQDAQRGLDGWVSGDMSSEDFKDLYANNWDPDLWEMYSDIFTYAREKRLPMIGLNIDRSIVRQISRQGFSSLSPAQKEQIGVISCSVDGKYREVIESAFGNKTPDPKTFSNFCEAQVVWDTVMANRAVEHIKANPDRILVILAGNFHAWKYGIPERIRTMTGLPYRVILPSKDESFMNYEIFLEEADYVWWKR